MTNPPKKLIASSQSFIAETGKRESGKAGKKKVPRPEGRERRRAVQAKVGSKLKDKGKISVFGPGKSRQGKEIEDEKS